MHVVTGGAGFIGSNIVAALAKRGEDVAVCDWLGSDDRWRNLAKHEIADIVNPEHLIPWLDQHQPEIGAVIHMGAISATTEANVDLLAERNIRFSLSLLRWCAEHRVALIYASSAATYGDGAAGFSDQRSREGLARLRPLNPYGWSKHVFDRRVAALTERADALPPQCVGLKFFNVYGPNEYHKGSMQSLLSKSFAGVKSGEPLRLYKSHRPEFVHGGQLRDFIYVRDCVEVVLWCLDHPEVSGLFNVGTGMARSWNDLASALFTAIDRAPQIEFIDMPSELAASYQYCTQADLGGLRAAGYHEPFTSLEAGVHDFVRSYLNHSDPYL